MHESFLHEFRGKAAEQRQFPRMTVAFLVSIKNDASDTAAAGIGIDISGGGISFLSQDHVPLRECSIGLHIRARRVQANIIVLAATEVVFNEELWRRHRAQFTVLLKTDFDFIMALTHPGSHTLVSEHAEAVERENSCGVVESFGMFPTGLKDKIVQILVGMKRLTPPKSSQLALLAAHYGGPEFANDGTLLCHRLRIRSQDGAMVFETNFRVSADGDPVVVRD
jgi:hypothetical protein